MFQTIKRKPHFIDSNKNNGNGQVYQWEKYVQEPEPNLLSETEYEIEYYFWLIWTNFVIVCMYSILHLYVYAYVRIMFLNFSNITLIIVIIIFRCSRIPINSEQFTTVQLIKKQNTET